MHARTYWMSRVWYLPGMGILSLSHFLNRFMLRGAQTLGARSHRWQNFVCYHLIFVGSQFGTWFLKALHPWYCCFIDHPRIFVALAWRFLCKCVEAGLPVGINEQMMVSMCSFTLFSENVVTWDTIGYHSMIYLEVICDLLHEMITCKHIYTHKYWQLKLS